MVHLTVVAIYPDVSTSRNRKMDTHTFIVVHKNAFTCVVKILGVTICLEDQLKATGTQTKPKDSRIKCKQG